MINLDQLSAKEQAIVAAVLAQPRGQRAEDLRRIVEQLARLQAVIQAIKAVEIVR